MKKIVCLILSLSIICSSMNLNCFANAKDDVNNMQSYEYLDPDEKTLEEFYSELEKYEDTKDLAQEEPENRPLNSYNNYGNKNLSPAKSILLGMMVVRNVLETLPQMLFDFVKKYIKLIGSVSVSAVIFFKLFDKGMIEDIF